MNKYEKKVALIELYKSSKKYDFDFTPPQLNRTRRTVKSFFYKGSKYVSVFKS